MRVSTAFLALAAFVTLGACGGSGGSSDGVPVITGQPAPLLYTLLVNTNDFQLPPDSEVEIVNLETHTRVGGFPLPGVRGSSLAVSPDGTRLFIADRQNGQVLVRTRAGGVIGSIPLPGAYDLVLDDTGTRLWAASFQPSKITRYDALTLAPAISIATPGLGGGIALSPDGTKVAWPSYTGYGGAISGCYLADAMTLASPAPVDFAVAPCNMHPNDTRFVNNTRLVVWDSNCDRLHLVDAVNHLMFQAYDVSLVQDGGASFNYNNCLAGSASSTRIHGFKESGQVFRVDPLIPVSNKPAGHTGSPFLVTLTPDEQSLLLFTSGSPVKIDVMSVSLETFTNDVYSFTSSLTIPRDAVTRFAAP